MQGQLAVTEVVYASFSRRLLAFLADVIPLTLLVALFFYTFLGFDKTLHRYIMAGPRNQQARREFLEERNTIRAIAGLAYVVYATLLHATPLRATLGKLLFGIRVVDKECATIGWQKSFWRTGAMILSILPGCIGCLAVLWSDKNQAWHDQLAGTYVVIRRSLRS